MRENKVKVGNIKKKVYKKPELVVFGSVSAVTQKNGSSTALDAGNSAHRAQFS
jgi:hypothetical protein